MENYKVNVTEEEMDELKKCYTESEKDLENQVEDIDDDTIDESSEELEQMMSDAMIYLCKALPELFDTLKQMNDIIVEDRARVNNAQMVTNAINILDKLYDLNRLTNEDYCTNLKFLLELQDLKMVNGKLEEIKK